MAFQQPERLLNHWWSFHLSTFTSGEFSRGQWSSTGGPWDKCSPPSCLRNQIPKNKHWIILTDKNVIFVINKICCCFNGTNCPCVFRSLTLWKKWTRFWECWWMDWQRKACTTVSTWSSHLTTVRYNPRPPPQLNLRQGSTRTCLQRLQQKWQSFGGWLLLSFYLDFIPKVQHLWMVSNMWETAFVSSWSPVTFSSLAPQSNIYLCWVTAPAHRKLMDGAKKTIWWEGIWWAENKLFSVVCIYVCCPHLKATC